MRRASILLAIALTALAACGGGEAPPASSSAEPSTTSEPPVFERTTAMIVSRGEQIELEVELAETDEQRAFGLMFREALPDETGMVFIFPADETGGFWMKNTLIPLSIAFFDKDGRIVRILDMEPCGAEPCPVYDPGVEYRGALEVNQGAFHRWGVREGDFIRVKVRP
jgi:uncharacterized protein